jgi:hypothetical protein
MIVMTIRDDPHMSILISFGHRDIIQVIGGEDKRSRHAIRRLGIPRL